MVRVCLAIVRIWSKAVISDLVKIFFIPDNWAIHRVTESIDNPISISLDSMHC